MTTDGTPGDTASPGRRRSISREIAPISAWGLLVTVDDWFHCHRRLVGALSIAAFALSCAQYAGFIALPKLLEIPARFAWAFPALKYGVWDGFVTPRLAERRRSLEAGQA